MLKYYKQLNGELLKGIPVFTFLKGHRHNRNWNSYQMVELGIANASSQFKCQIQVTSENFLFKKKRISSHDYVITCICVLYWIKSCIPS